MGTPGEVVNQFAKGGILVESWVQFAVWASVKGFAMCFSFPPK